MNVFDQTANDVFISHDRVDTRYARLLRGYFRSHNIVAWLDRTNNPASENQDESKAFEKICSEIKKSRYLLVIVSENIDKGDWVRREVEYALSLRDGGYPIRIAAIILEPDVEKPDWLKKVNDVTDFNPNDRDPLRDLREEIGDDKPTYIDNVDGSFIKYVHINKLQENIAKSDTRSFDVWLFNGQTTVPHHLEPALRRMGSNAPGRLLKGRVLLGASAANRRILNNGSSERHAIKRFSESYQLSMNQSHEQCVQASFELMRALTEEYPDLSVECKVTPTFPPGRIIILDDVAFFAPYTHRFNATLPLQMADAHNDFYHDLKSCFEAAFNNAEPAPS